MFLWRCKKGSLFSLHYWFSIFETEWKASDGNMSWWCYWQNFGLHSKNEVSSLCIMHLTSQHFFLKKGKSPLECLHVQEDQEEWVLLEREIFALYCPLQHGLSSCWFTTPNYKNHFFSGEKNIHNIFCHSHGMSNFCAFPFNFPMNKSVCMNGITISICDFLSLFSEIEKANVLLAPIPM